MSHSSSGIFIYVYFQVLYPFSRITIDVDKQIILFDNTELFHYLLTLTMSLLVG